MSDRRALVRTVVPVIAAVSLLLSGCSSDQETGSAVPSATESGSGTTPDEATCTPEATASYPPLSAMPKPGAMPAGTLMRTIADRGYLVVGVSGDTRLLGARNMLNGGVLEGFDIDMARYVARMIFGDSKESRIHFRVITAGQRIPLVNDGAGTADHPLAGVDMIARAMTMTCSRWNNSDPTKRVAFSSVYLMAHQRLLVRKDSGLTSLEALAEVGAKVCAPRASTSLERIADTPGITPVPAAIHSDCLALWQEGEVEAITGDDAILAGFAAQDPSAVVVGEPLEDEPYGLAVSTEHPEFARFLNNVLDSARANGTWDRLYATWLQPSLGRASAPAPNYSRPL